MAVAIFGDGKTKIDSSQVTAANTARDGSGTIVDIAVGGDYGSTVQSVEITGTGANVAGVIRFFIHNGSAYRLLDEVLVPATTPSATVEVFRTTWVPPSDSGSLSFGFTLDLPATWKLGASTHNAETFNLKTKYRDN